MKVRLEDLPPHTRAQVLAQLKLLPVKPKEKSPRRKPVLVKAPIFCSRCGSYEHVNMVDSDGNFPLDAKCPIETLPRHGRVALFAVPIRTSNEQNQDMGKHWGVKSGKRSQVRDAIGRAWKAAGIVLRPAGYRVTITRIAPLVDQMNLDSCLKSVIDEVAARMGVDDASPLVEWVRRQENAKPSEPAVRVAIEEIV